MQIHRVVNHYSLIEATQEATHYYLVPQHQKMIPACSHAQRVLVTLLGEAHDIHSPTMITEYPKVTRQHAKMFSWQRVSVKVRVQKYLHGEEVIERAKPKPVTLNI